MAKDTELKGADQVVFESGFKARIMGIDGTWWRECYIEVISQSGAKITVEMTERAAKDRLARRGEIYLDAEEDFKDEKNLAIVITEGCAAKYKNAGIDEPAGHFKDKTILVTGTVTLKEKRPRIEVNDPKQIEEVK